MAGDGVSETDLLYPAIDLYPDEGEDEVDDRSQDDADPAALVHGGDHAAFLGLRRARLQRRCGSCCCYRATNQKARAEKSGL